MEEFQKSEIYKTSINATVPNVNARMKYYWMINAKGVKVPVAIHNLKDALKRGYKHTDNVEHEDDPKDHYQYGQEIKSHNPIDRLTNTLEKFVGGQAQKSEQSQVENKEPQKEEVKKDVEKK